MAELLSETRKETLIPNSKGKQAPSIVPLLEPSRGNGNCTRTAKEAKIIQWLNSGDASTRCRALKILCRRGGPGAGKHIAKILNGDGNAGRGVKEKLLAIEAIFEISHRTGMYHKDGLLQLELARREGFQPEAVREKARIVGDRIPGCCMLVIIPGMKLDNRLLIG